MIILLRSDTPGRTPVWSFERSLVLIPRRARWNNGVASQVLEYNIVCFSQGWAKFEKVGRALEFCSFVLDDRTRLETTDEYKLHIPPSSFFSTETFDLELNNGLQNGLTAKGLDVLKEFIGMAEESASSKYAKTAKGKSRRRKHEETKKEMTVTFRKAEIWIKANPGMTISDYMKRSS